MNTNLDAVLASDTFFDIDQKTLIQESTAAVKAVPKSTTTDKPKQTRTKEEVLAEWDVPDAGYPVPPEYDTEVLGTTAEGAVITGTTGVYADEWDWDAPTTMNTHVQPRTTPVQQKIPGRRAAPIKFTPEQVRIVLALTADNFQTKAITAYLNSQPGGGAFTDHAVRRRAKLGFTDYKPEVVITDADVTKSLARYKKNEQA